MTHLSRIQKLIEKLESLSAELDCEKSLHVHHRIDQFYYLEKAAELRFLLEQFEEAERKIDHLVKLIECDYVSIYTQWRKDIRWINHRKRNPVP